MSKNEYDIVMSNTEIVESGGTSNAPLMKLYVNWVFVVVLDTLEELRTSANDMLIYILFCF